MGGEFMRLEGAEVGVQVLGQALEGRFLLASGAGGDQVDVAGDVTKGVAYEGGQLFVRGAAAKADAYDELHRFRAAATKRAGTSGVAVQWTCR
ncbi:hypothetical protein GCM10009804_09480 [Kribbella hippodromi]|uniref:Uncharacterized protein n=1 Tax=Kribbella hippodromi TaxID=434347 RepID=A0ABN2CE70_9ACTN